MELRNRKVGDDSVKEEIEEDKSDESTSTTVLVDFKKLPFKERMALARKGPTLIFDGICNLCNGSMTWFQDRVRPDSPVFYMWAQHPDTHALLQEIGISRHDILRSWAYLEDGIVYRGSGAWLQALRNLQGPWRFLSSLDKVPEFVRETVYNTVAANRYNALGHSDACQRPNASMRARFLHSTAVKGQSPPPDTTTIPPRERRRLLIVGCGPAGLLSAKKLAPLRKDWEILVVEPKDFFEFTPGILRGMCHPESMKDLVFPLEPVLCDSLKVSYVQGVVTSLESRTATVKRCKLSDGTYGILNQAGADVGGGNRVDENETFLTPTDDPDYLKITFDYCVIAAGSQYSTSRLWKVPVPTNNNNKNDTSTTNNDKTNIINPYTMEGRIAELAEEAAKLGELNETKGGRVSIFGAGLVGVELASEIAHYYPDIHVSLYDPMPTVLPAMGESSQTYATSWLQQHNVQLVLGDDFTEDAVKKAEKQSNVVYKCVGVSIQTNFLPASVKDARGQVRVNAAMQVLMGEKHVNPAELDMMGPERAAIFGSGRIFAIGDCVSVQGSRQVYVKDTYPAEAMAEIVVSNLKRSKTIQCMRTCPGMLSELGSLLVMTVCSLGPNDAIFTINNRMVSWGLPATLVKGTIQYTKVSDSKNELLGRAVWKFVPHL